MRVDHSLGGFCASSASRRCLAAVTTATVAAPEVACSRSTKCCPSVRPFIRPSVCMNEWCFMVLRLEVAAGWLAVRRPCIEETRFFAQSFFLDSLSLSLPRLAHRSFSSFDSVPLLLRHVDPILHVLKVAFSLIIAIRSRHRLFSRHSPPTLFSQFTPFSIVAKLAKIRPTTTTTPEDILLEFIVHKSPHIYTVCTSHSVCGLFFFPAPSYYSFFLFCTVSFFLAVQFLPSNRASRSLARTRNSAWGTAG